MTSAGALLVIAAAGALGAIARDTADRAVLARLPGARLPAGILVVNIAGSFALGLLAGAAGRVGGPALLVGGVGFLGAFTTFSTFAVQAVRLPRRAGARYVAAMLAGCVAAAALGLALTSPA